jgi:hypothetical protein
MKVDAGWHVGRGAVRPTDKQKTHVSLEGITLNQFDGVIKNTNLSNQDRHAAAITKADGSSWQIANPWFKRTDTNLKLVNNWLASKGINYPIYADFTEAAEELVNTGLLAIDEVERVQHLDGNGPKKFKGALTGREYDSLDSMIAQEQDASLHKIEQPSDLEAAFDALPAEQALQMLRNAEKQSQAVRDGAVSQQNADSWITLHPESRDDEYNGRLLLSQLKANGVTGVVTIEDYEIANRQLVSAGLLRQNPAALRKQEAAEVTARAERAVKTPGSVFDTTSEADMYNLPMDELRRRASGNYTGSDRL